MSSGVLRTNNICMEIGRCGWKTRRPTTHRFMGKACNLSLYPCSQVQPVLQERANLAERLQGAVHPGYTLIKRR
jgi:hypothetical protein